MALGRSLLHGLVGSAILCCVFPNGAQADPSANGFREIERTDEIVVSVRDEPGHVLPTLRAQGAITGSVLHVLAVLLDDAHSSEWAEGSDEARVLREINPRTHIVYSRSHQPWPVRDRDLVMRRTVEVLEPAKAFHVQLQCISGETPKLDGVLRVTDCHTSIWLRDGGNGKTLVDYRVRAEAGGDAPAWLVRRASLHVPLDTLRGLARQVRKTKGKYEAQIRHWRSESRS